MGAPGPSTAPRDVLLSQSASTYNEDLRKALNLSKKHMDGASIEKEEMERAFKMSLLDSSKPKTEEEQIEIAIKASLKDFIMSSVYCDHRVSYNLAMDAATPLFYRSYGRWVLLRFEFSLPGT